MKTSPVVEIGFTGARFGERLFLSLPAFRYCSLRPDRLSQEIPATTKHRVPWQRININYDDGAVRRERTAVNNF